MSIAGNIRSIINPDSCGNPLWQPFYRTTLLCSKLKKEITYSLPVNDIYEPAVTDDLDF